MSLILTSAAAAGAFYMVGDHVDKINAKARAEKKASVPPKKVAKKELYTGRYGHFSELADRGFEENRIVSIRTDRDLSGVPMRWIEMPNGAVFQTYDMDYPQMK